MHWLKCFNVLVNCSFKAVLGNHFNRKEQEWIKSKLKDPVNEFAFSKSGIEGGVGRLKVWW